MPTSKTRQSIVRKPKQSRSKATVAAIIDAAARVLAEEGWAGFNTNVIAQRAGVSIGSLYEYFSDKQALVDAIASDHLAKGERFLSSLPAGVDGTGDPAALVDGLVEGLVDLHKDDPRLHRVLSSEVPLSPDIRNRVEKLRQGAVALVGQALSTHVRNPHVAGQLMVDAADAVIHRWFVEDDGKLATHERLTEELRRMMHAYLRAIAKKKNQ